MENVSSLINSFLCDISSSTWCNYSKRFILPRMLIILTTDLILRLLIIPIIFFHLNLINKWPLTRSKLEGAYELQKGVKLGGWKVFFLIRGQNCYGAKHRESKVHFSHNFLYWGETIVSFIRLIYCTCNLTTLNNASSTSNLSVRDGERER